MKYLITFIYIFYTSKVFNQKIKRCICQKAVRFVNNPASRSTSLVHLVTMLLQSKGQPAAITPLTKSITLSYDQQRFCLPLLCCTICDQWCCFFEIFYFCVVSPASSGLRDMQHYYNLYNQRFLLASLCAPPWHFIHSVVVHFTCTWSPVQPKVAMVVHLLCSFGASKKKVVLFDCFAITEIKDFKRCDWLCSKGA